MCSSFLFSCPRVVRFGVAAVLISTMTAPLSAGTWRELPHPGAGFIGPGPASEPPESSPCMGFGYPASAGFPYKNRSLVVDLGDPAPAVHRIVLIDDYSDNGGDSPVVRKYGLQLYTSDDNLTYARYTGPVRLHFRTAGPEGGFDAVVLDELRIRSRYIKLHAEIPDETWDLGNHHLNRMVRVFQDTDRVADITGLADNLVLNKGEEEIMTVSGTADNPGDFLVSADKPILVVQYMVGAFMVQQGGSDGDPSMVQAVPVEQFLDHYVVLIPDTWENNYLVLTRSHGQMVSVDGTPVDSGWVPVGASLDNPVYEVARVSAEHGIHVLEGAGPFGVIVVGFDQYDSYAYPGGLDQQVINPIE